MRGVAAILFVLVGCATPAHRPSPPIVMSGWRSFSCPSDDNPDHDPIPTGWTIADPTLGNIVGEVTNARGKRMANIAVSIFAGGRVVARSVTDDRGIYHTLIAPGTYWVSFYFEGFVAFRRAVFVQVQRSAVANGTITMDEPAPPKKPRCV